jgi:dinuclear metal center YbgI/SA1388 family protein
MVILISKILEQLQILAHPSLQESYDNAGLIAGELQNPCTGVMCCLDVTEDVLEECMQTGSNLIVAHHPVIFSPLKKLRPISFSEKILIKAIKNDIAIYAIHTNYDNVYSGVNLALSKKIGLKMHDLRILEPKGDKIAKLYTFIPPEFEAKLKKGLFEAGAGTIGKYSECSFSTSGRGNFKPMEGTNPFIGKSGGITEEVKETKLEVIFPIWLKSEIIAALKENHPYEEVAYEIILTENEHQEIGSGMIGQIHEEINEHQFLELIRKNLEVPMLRHSAKTGRLIKKVAFCGGAGSFLISKAIKAGADAFLTADLKYHDFFAADSKLILIDIGHFESEIASIDYLCTYLRRKFPTFAVLHSKVNTNPVHYFMD